MTVIFVIIYELIRSTRRHSRDPVYPEIVMDILDGAEDAFNESKEILAPLDSWVSH